MSNSEILMWVLGWQGGTIHQVAAALRGQEGGYQLTEEDWISLILGASVDQLRDLCRLAQAARRAMR